MGLSGAIKKRLRELAPESFVQESETRQKRTPTNVHVDLLDYLTRFVAIKDRDTKLFTHDELFAHFWAHPQFSDSVLCITICDDRSRVTRAKDETHAVRATRAAKDDARKGVEAAKSYPVDAEFWSGGVTYKGVAEDGDEGEKEGAEPEQQVFEAICLRRLSKSRNPKGCNLGNTLWQSFVPRIQSAMAGVTKKQFVLDIDRGTGAMGFEPGSKEPPTPFASTHELGEADPAMLFWTRELEDQSDDIHWYSNDSDLIALYLLYHDRRTPAQRANVKIWWHCENGIAVDMALMADLMVARTHGCLSAAMLGISFILPGDDFVDQRKYAFGFGPLKIIEAFLRLDARAIRARRDTARSIFEQFLSDLYNRKRVLSIPPLLQPHLTPLSFDELRELHPLFPDDETIERQALRFHYNVVYWYLAALGKQPPCPDPSTSRKRKRDADATGESLPDSKRLPCPTPLPPPGDAASVPSPSRKRKRDVGADPTLPDAKCHKASEVEAD